MLSRNIYAPPPKHLINQAVFFRSFDDGTASVPAQDDRIINQILFKSRQNRLCNAVFVWSREAKTSVKAILFELVSKMSKSAVFADVMLSKDVILQ